MDPQGNFPGTIQRQTRSTLEKMEDIIEKPKVSLDSQHKAISELIKMITTKSKPIPEILELFEQTEKILEDNITASKLLEALKEVTKLLKVSHESLIDKVTSLGNEVDDLKNQVSNLQAAVEKLTQELQTSNRDLARLKLRHILRRTQSLVYKHFVPNVNLQKSEFRVKQLKGMNKFKSPPGQKELKDFLTSVDFDDQMETDTEDILLGCDLHQSAHPVTDVEATVSNIAEFKQLVEQCDIDDVYQENCVRIATTYFKLLDKK